MRSLSSIALLSVVGAASAQAGPWAQCGGKSFSGSSECASGWKCQELNEWFSQCSTTPTVSSTPTPTDAPSVSITASVTTGINKSISVSSASKSTPLPSSSSASPSPRPTGSGSFAKADGLQFSIDGETKYFAGTNAYWLPFQMNDADIDSVFDHLEQAGLKILRVWGFNDVNTAPSPGTVYFQLHDKEKGTSTINTGKDGLQRLDYVVAAAEKHGVKLIIPFVNSWDDYGGYNAYVKAYGGSKTEWFTNEKIQSVYQAYIKAVVSRYRDSPAIFAWELGNEPRCSGCSTDVIHGWATKISAYIKSLDPNHMVALGDGGIKDNAWGNGWVENHAKACKAAGKPCLFEEYGMKGNHCTDELKWQKTSLSSGTAADLIWQYGQQLSTGESPKDAYSIFYGTDEWKCAVMDHMENVNKN
ncbi:unnamed protein product [Aspergillus oryzae]|uniref:mannan endo-1,4-beta-mannosidase n=2 Tax=Aspergillus oryzae TaxID=5062 RepID=A0AAN4YSL7_ASPOZ|nr:unnamed protein product [Aspergillus oryzae]GMF93803.1 unnamed protein product [Aspergillus oryzae]GMG06334.1 unnamed protein product [Aspergillus oryzae]GMG32362.1 unnamed protein product [Aspergillus oryzae]GMG41248.1 unnamed protein product [Aspergillus oryzae var. brunneus]